MKNRKHFYPQSLEGCGMAWCGEVDTAATRQIRSFPDFYEKKFRDSGCPDL